MTAKEARKLIGKPVKYRHVRRGWSPSQWEHGIVNDVQGKNILIDRDWLWLPELAIREVNE